jgi:protein required for attachment to host cells
MIIPNNATIAVVDGEKMRLFRNKAVEPQVDLVERTSPELDTDNQGSGSRHRSSSANPDLSRQTEDNFAASAADHLNRDVLEGRIENLIIVADPRTLGELRKNRHQKLEGILIGELSKDLTGHSVEDITAALQKA